MGLELNRQQMRELQSYIVQQNKVDQFDDEGEEEEEDAS